MKSEIEHCKHFDVINQKRLETCPNIVMCSMKKYDDNAHPCIGVILHCIGFTEYSNKDCCQYYED